MLAIAAWAYITSFIVLKAIDSVVGLRVTPEEEIAGLDASEHGTTAYGDFIIKKQITKVENQSYLIRFPPF